MNEAHLRALVNCAPAALAIGGSAGAVEALTDVLPCLAATLPVPTLVVVHVPPDRASALPALFEARCAVRVCEAEDKVRAEPGCVYFAPPDYHMLLERDGTLALSVDQPEHYSRPSIDILFESASHALGHRLLGILLSGASADGAEGLATIRRRGGLTWVQAPATARVDAMPRAALALEAHETLEPPSMGLVLAAWGGCLHV